MIKRLTVIFTIIFVGFATFVSAADYEITYIKPAFNKATPLFGDFEVEVEIKSKVEKKTEISVACFYSGLTHPGVYYQDEPQIIKQYKQVNIAPRGTAKIVFDNKFISYHPETKGELIISIMGTGIVRSYPLKTRFHPDSND
jgi:hypothetical protein